MKGKPNSSLEAQIPPAKRDLFRLARRVLLALDGQIKK
jgi:hypothetical protein